MFRKKIYSEGSLEIEPPQLSSTTLFIGIFLKRALLQNYRSLLQNIVSFMRRFCEAPQLSCILLERIFQWKETTLSCILDGKRQLLDVFFPPVYKFPVFGIREQYYTEGSLEKVGKNPEGTLE